MLWPLGKLLARLLPAQSLFGHRCYLLSWVWTPPSWGGWFEVGKQEGTRFFFQRSWLSGLWRLPGGIGRAGERTGMRPSWEQWKVSQDFVRSAAGFSVLPAVG